MNSRLDREIEEALGCRRSGGADRRRPTLVPGVGQVHELEDRLETSDGRLVAVKQDGHWSLETRLGRTVAKRVAAAFPELFAGTYRVAYLVPNPRRGQPDQEAMLRLWYAGEDKLQTLPEAMADLRAAKRRGLTAWVTDADGNHVPVAGAARPHPGRYATY